MFPVDRRRPHRDTARRAWERSWAADLAQFYTPDRPPPSYERLVDVVYEVLVTPSDASILNGDFVKRSVCQLQTEVVADVQRILRLLDFENAWRGAESTRREECILDGLARVCDIAGCMERRRGLCPELTLSALASDDGEGYLRLLRRYLLTGSAPTHGPTTTRIVEPLYLAHPVMDRIFHLSPDEMQRLGYRMYVDSFRLNRAHYMTSVLWNVILSFVGAFFLFQYPL